MIQNVPLKLIKILILIAEGNFWGDICETFEITHNMMCTLLLLLPRLCPLFTGV